MTGDEDLSDEERIAIGLDPLQGEHLHDTNDLWRVLERLGYDQAETLPTTVWDYVNWSCPLDDCDGSVYPVDSRMRNLPADTDYLDGGSPEDIEAHNRLTKARSLNAPLVTCNECESAFDVSFRRLMEPDEYSLPEPGVVETDDTLHGSPRIDGTRIGVKHVMTFHDQGYSPEEIVREMYPVLTEDHVRTAINWAKEHPDRLAEDRRRDREVRLRHDIMSSAVQAAVEGSLDQIWSITADTKAMGGVDPVVPVAGFIRNGFENADGLDVSIDTDDRRVVIDVDDEVVARLNDHVDAPSADSPQSDDGGESTDVNEQVTAEWVEKTTAFERVQSVMRDAYEPRPVSEIADHAQLPTEEAMVPLNRLATVGYVESVEVTDDGSAPRYRRDPMSVACEQARDILRGTDADKLDDRIAEMEADIDAYREEYSVQEPEAAPNLDDYVRREWKTTRRNLQFAKVARSLRKASSDAVSVNR